MKKIIDKITGFDVPIWGNKYKVKKSLISEEKIIADMDFYNVMEKPIWGGIDKVTGQFVEIPIYERPFKISIPMVLISTGVVSQLNPQLTYKDYTATLTLFAPNFYDEDTQKVTAFFKTLSTADGFAIDDEGVISCLDTNLEFDYIKEFEYMKKGDIMEKEV